jgi:hypothetical protein
MDAEYYSLSSGPGSSFTTNASGAKRRFFSKLIEPVSEMPAKSWMLEICIISFFLLGKIESGRPASIVS